jgi:hypothetical protein
MSDCHRLEDKKMKQYLISGVKVIAVLIIIVELASIAIDLHNQLQLQLAVSRLYVAQLNVESESGEKLSTPDYSGSNKFY